ncbi:MAG: hypothetical protein IIU00_06165 [Clostridia bacterium]|nr:hypothetical protein [Clostridia bacterium]
MYHEQVRTVLDSFGIASDFPTCLSVRVFPHFHRADSRGIFLLSLILPEVLIQLLILNSRKSRSFSGRLFLFFSCISFEEGENVAGQPKRFKKKEFENYVLDYFADIYEQQTEDGTTDIPTFYGFYRYVSQRRDCSYHTVRRRYDLHSA